MTRLQQRRTWVLGVAIVGLVLTAALALRWTAPRRSAHGDPELERLRTQLMTSADNFVAIEVQRFVPPKPGQPLDQYSHQLESASQRVFWEARIGVAAVLADLRSLDGEHYAAGKARAMAAVMHLSQLLATIDTSEDNERHYITEMQTTLDAIGARLSGRPARRSLTLPSLTAPPPPVPQP